MDKEIVVHASALSRYHDCPRRAAASIFNAQVKKDHQIFDERRSVASAIGNAVHGMMAELFAQRLAGQNMDVELAVEAREQKFLNDLDQDVLWNKTTPHTETARKQVRALCKAFLPIAAMTEPKDYETKLEVYVSPLGGLAIPVKLIGTRDVLDRKGEIQDHKTGKNFPKCHAQLGGYAIQAEMTGDPIYNVRVNYAETRGVRSLDETVARSVRLDLEECRQAAWNTIKQIQLHYIDYLERYSSGNLPEQAFPANPHSSLCTEKYCTVYGTTWCRIGCVE